MGIQDRDYYRETLKDRQNPPLFRFRAFPRFLRLPRRLPSLDKLASLPALTWMGIGAVLSIILAAAHHYLR